MQLNLKFSFPNSKIPEIAFKALKPELHGSHEKRSETNVILKNDCLLLLSIKAVDKTALKASLNSYLKLFNLALELSKLEVF